MKPAFTEVTPERGLLRKSMLDRLIDQPIVSHADYLQLIPAAERRVTADVHIDAYLDTVISILSQTS